MVTSASSAMFSSVGAAGSMPTFLANMFRNQFPAASSQGVHFQISPGFMASTLLQHQIL